MRPDDTIQGALARPYRDGSRVSSDQAALITLGGELAVSGQSLLAASGHILVSANNKR